MDTATPLPSPTSGRPGRLSSYRPRSGVETWGGNPIRPNASDTGPTRRWGPMRRRLIGAAVALALASGMLACGGASRGGGASSLERSAAASRQAPSGHDDVGFADEVSIFSVRAQGGLPVLLTRVGELEHEDEHEEEHEGGEEEAHEEQQV